jgi:hypothetical protein
MVPWHRSNRTAPQHGHPKRGRRWTTKLLLQSLETRCVLSPVFRSIDGSSNNLVNPDWGAANTDLLRIAPAAYSDGVSAMAGADRPSPREISDAVDAQSDTILNNRQMSDWVWQWGQFLDHDLDLTPQPGTPPEHANVPVPTGDPFFDPNGTGTQVIGFDRSVYDHATGTGTDNPRQQPNVLTSYIDGSQVYGSDPVRAAALRTFHGGKLKTSPGGLLPLNNTTYFGDQAPLSNANSGPFPDDQLYVAGDVRANENIGLTAVQTLFVREHNLWCNVLAAFHRNWNDETLYQWARKIVGAEIEVITYKEFLPAIMGTYAPFINGRYDPTVNAAVATEFSTAGFRVGHTLLSNQILRIQNNGQPDPRGPVSLADSFFNPPLLTNGRDLSVLLKGLASQEAEEIDNQLVDGVRNFLFGPPGAGGFDLASLNIQRGRDHGLSDYNTTRAAYGLPRVQSFADITSDPDLQNALAAEYGSVDNIDLWVGALAEDHLPGSSLGALETAIFRDQFTRLRDGDRLYFENDPSFSRFDVAFLKQTTLAEIIRRNTGVTRLQADVFLFNPEGSPGASEDGGSRLQPQLLGQFAAGLADGDSGSQALAALGVGYRAAPPAAGLMAPRTEVVGGRSLFVPPAPAGTGRTEDGVTPAADTFSGQPAQEAAPTPADAIDLSFSLPGLFA